MCEAWHVDEKVYRRRVYNKWPIKYALETPIGCKTFCDHDGNVFSTLSAMLRSYGIPKDIFQMRIDEGWNLDDALLNKVE